MWLFWALLPLCWVSVLGNRRPCRLGEEDVWVYFQDGLTLGCGKVIAYVKLKPVSACCSQGMLRSHPNAYLSG